MQALLGDWVREIEAMVERDEKEEDIQEQQRLCLDLTESCEEEDGGKGGSHKSSVASASRFFLSGPIDLRSDVWDSRETSPGWVPPSDQAEG
jgi:hypothetical protein